MVLGNEGEGDYVKPRSIGAKAIYGRTNGWCARPEPDYVSVKCRDPDGYIVEAAWESLSRQAS
jgi:hypothetical protein